LLVEQRLRPQSKGHVIRREPVSTNRETILAVEFGSHPRWSKNPICMKPKDNRASDPVMPELGVTPRYITRRSPCNVGLAPHGSQPANISCFQRDRGLDPTPGGVCTRAVQFLHHGHGSCPKCPDRNSRPPFEYERLSAPRVFAPPDPSCEPLWLQPYANSAGRGLARCRAPGGITTLWTLRIGPHA
jgi:hypothetical protein